MNNITVIQAIPISPPDSRPTWCSDMFPVWLSAIVYLVASVMIGFTLAGLVYNIRYRKTLSKIFLDDRSRTFGRFLNRFHGRQTYIIVLCLLGLILSLIVFIFAFVWFTNNTFCGFFILLIIFLVALVGTGLFFGIKYAIQRHKGRKQRLEEAKKKQEAMDAAYDEVMRRGVRADGARNKTQVFF